MNQDPASPARSTSKRLMMLFLTAHLFFPIAWLWSQVVADQPDHRDWYYLRLAGERFLHRDWPSIYASVDEGFLWRYPPFALYLAAILALLDPSTAYWLIVLVSIGALATALYLLHAALHPPSFGLVALAVATSAAFTSVLITGQNSPFIALTIAAGLLTLLRGHRTTPFVFFGLLAVKPNWLPIFALFALVGRHFKGLLVMVAIGLGILAAGLPLGVTGDFLDVSFTNSALLTEFPAYKLITMRSFIGVLTDSTIALVAVLMVLGASGLFVWWPTTKAPLARQISVVVLITIAANPYVAFYDGLVIMIPATIWWATRDTYASKAAWRGIGGLIAGIWLWDQAVFFYASTAGSLGLATLGPPAVSLVGPALALWVLLETFDIGASSRGSRAPSHVL